MPRVDINYKYGTIYVDPRESIDIVNKLNPKKHWWYPRIDKPLTQVVTDIFESVEIKLGYYPNLKNFDVLIVAGADELHSLQYELYGDVRYFDVKGFASLSRNTVYMCQTTLNRNVLKHEFGHLLFHLMISKQNVKRDLHETVARFVEG